MTQAENSLTCTSWAGWRKAGKTRRDQMRQHKRPKMLRDTQPCKESREKRNKQTFKENIQKETFDSRRPT